MKNEIWLGIQCSVELCAILYGGASETLISDTLNFIQKRNLFPVTQKDIEFVIEKNFAARKFYDYDKKNPMRVNVDIPKRLMRTLWLAQTIGANYKKISLNDIQSLVSKKYEEEKNCDKNLTEINFGLLKIVHSYSFCTNNFYEVGEIYSHLLQVFPAAYKVLADIFKNINACNYMTRIYNLNSGSEIASSQITPTEEKSATKSCNTVVKLDKNDISKDSTNSVEKSTIPTNSVAKTTISTNNDTKSTIPTNNEANLEDIIKLLEKDKKDLNLQLRYEKNNTVRELLIALTDDGWDAPLSELYLLLKDDQTPKKISGIINNLFMVLKKQGIRLIEEKSVGQVIVINDENQDSFDPIKNEKIVLEDDVLICYPGFKYEKKIMIKPKIKKYIGGDKK